MHSKADPQWSAVAEAAPIFSLGDTDGVAETGTEGRDTGGSGGMDC